jgi:DNA adenine methylase
MRLTDLAGVGKNREHPSNRKAMLPDPNPLKGRKKRPQGLEIDGFAYGEALLDDGCKGVLATQPSAAMVAHLGHFEKPTNVSQVRQLSPFRYPGGKTWLVPEVRKWLKAEQSEGSILIEPFAGGAMAGLTTAAEGLCHHVVLGEIDEDVAAVWRLIFHAPRSDVDWLCRQIRGFEVNLARVKEVLDTPPSSIRARAFRTIVKNRMQRGGIMAPGAGLVKEGEAGKGLRSRWYPDTLAKRIEALFLLRGKITFEAKDAFDMIRAYAADAKARFFVDPPYTAGGKRAGSRLYSHNDVDHEALFGLLASVQGAVMLTYDDAPEVRAMAARHGFHVEAIPMKNTHHDVIRELLIFKPANGEDAVSLRQAPTTYQSLLTSIQSAA